MSSYPTSIWSPTTKNTNDVIQPAHVNDAQSEIVAIETVLVNSVNVSASAIASIAFPNVQVASAGINTLDDYEEFTWTPTFVSSGGAGAPTYTTQVGHYTKIGRFVFLNGAIQMATKGTLPVGDLNIGGLPFTSFSSTSAYSTVAIGGFQNMSTSVSWLGGNIAPNTSSIQLTQVPAAGATTTTNTLVADVGATVLILFSAVYITAT